MYMLALSYDVEHSSTVQWQFSISVDSGCWSELVKVDLSRRKLMETMDRPRRMEMDYSLKNISLYSQRTYRKWLIEKVESVVRRMRWKAFFFLSGRDEEATDGADSAQYGFKSKLTPPQIEELKGFEEDLTTMIESIKFCKVDDPFHKKITRGY